MAEAMLKPLIESGRQEAERIVVVEVNEARVNFLRDTYGVQATSALKTGIEGADLIICAVKPQNTAMVFKSMFASADPNSMMLSIVAGCTIGNMVSSTNLTKVVRSMPNTPATIGQGITVWTSTKNLGEHDNMVVRELLQTLGEEIRVEEERYLDIATALSGSGPAYVLLMMEAMIEAGVHMGFSRPIATRLVQKTLVGTSLYASQSGQHTAILRNDITSPGGTSASALYELESGGFRPVLTDAIWAAYRRSLEMGGEDSNVGPGRGRRKR